MLPALDTLGGPALGVELENLTYQLAVSGPTFAGRDIFAPAAAFLAGGGPLGELGPALDLESLVRLPAPVCRRRGNALEVEVIVDRPATCSWPPAPTTSARPPCSKNDRGQSPYNEPTSGGHRRALGRPGRPHLWRPRLGRAGSARRFVRLPGAAPERRQGRPVGHPERTWCGSNRQ